VHTWLRSEIRLISPFLDWLMNRIAGSRCVRGREELVELALRETVRNAMLHGNRTNVRKLVHVRCCSDDTKGVFIVVRDQGYGFDPHKVPDPLAIEKLTAEHGRGIHLLEMAMDEVSFQGGGTEVHIWKQPTNEQGVSAESIQNRIVRRLVTRPWPSVRAIELGRGWDR
jgi:anti-sigma regulatory factor (Ser/Thr protein kinase)